MVETLEERRLRRKRESHKRDTHTLQFWKKFKFGLAGVINILAGLAMLTALMALTWETAMFTHRISSAEEAVAPYNNFDLVEFKLWIGMREVRIRGCVVECVDESQPCVAGNVVNQAPERCREELLWWSDAEDATKNPFVFLFNTQKSSGQNDDYMLAGSAASFLVAMAVVCFVWTMLGIVGVGEQDFGKRMAVIPSLLGALWFGFGIIVFVFRKGTYDDPQTTGDTMKPELAGAGYFAVAGVVFCLVVCVMMLLGKGGKTKTTLLFADEEGVFDGDMAESGLGGKKGKKGKKKRKKKKNSEMMRLL